MNSWYFPVSSFYYGNKYIIIGIVLYCRGHDLSLFPLPIILYYAMSSICILLVYTLGCWWKKDSSTWITTPGLPRVIVIPKRLVEQTSLSHRYTSIALPTSTLAAALASDTGYSCAHQKMSISHLHWTPSDVYVISRGRGLYLIYTLRAAGQRLCNHVETDTKWYNQLVPWATWTWQRIHGLATTVSAIKCLSVYLATVQSIIRRPLSIESNARHKWPQSDAGFCPTVASS